MLRSLARTYHDAFQGLPRAVWVLAACLFVNRLGMMVMPFFELYLTEERGFSIAAAGRIVASYGIGSVSGVLAGGWLTDVFGPRRVQLVSLTLNGVLLLVLGAMRSPWSITATFVSASLAGESFRPANGAAISAAIGPAGRARAFSLMSLAVCVGLTIGLPLGGLLAKQDYAWLFRVDGGTALLAALFLWRFGERAESVTLARGEPLAAASPWKDREFVWALVLQCATGTVLFQFFGALPVFLERELGFDTGGVGRALALNTVLVALFQMPIVRRFESRPALAWVGLGAFLICAGYGVNALAGGTTVAMLSIVVWSLGEIFFFPFSAALATQRAPPGAIGRYMSAYGTSLALPFVLAPLFGTAVYEGFGARALWLGCGALGILIALGFAALARDGQRRGGSL